MSYETRFYMQYSFDDGDKIDEKIYERSVTKSLRRNFRNIVEHMQDSRIDYDDTSRHEILDDWFQFIVKNNGNYISMAYEYLDLYIDIARQFVADGLTQHVKILFSWDGEEAGDYTENIYHYRKTGEVIRLTKDKEITTTVEEPVENPRYLSREYS